MNDAKHRHVPVGIVTDIWGDKAVIYRDYDGLDLSNLRCPLPLDQMPILRQAVEKAEQAMRLCAVEMAKEAADNEF